MNKRKKQSLTILLAAIIAVSIFTVVVDFSRLTSFNSVYNQYPNEVIKRINVFLAAVIVLLAGKDKLSKKNHRYMKLAFTFICLGELLFLISSPFTAILAFAIAQCLLIARHALGIKSKLSNLWLIHKLELAFWGFALIFLFLFAVLYLFNSTISKELFAAGCLYGLILSISLWMGLANYTLNLSPKPNSTMIAIGMLCFYCCDILVGLDGILGYGTPWLVVTSFIWIFYTPAITLLALSCYRYSTYASLNNRLTSKSSASVCGKGLLK